MALTDLPAGLLMAALSSELWRKKPSALKQLCGPGSERIMKNTKKKERKIQWSSGNRTSPCLPLFLLPSFSLPLLPPLYLSPFFSRFFLISQSFVVFQRNDAMLWLLWSVPVVVARLCHPWNRFTEHLLAFTPLLPTKLSNTLWETSFRKLNLNCLDKNVNKHAVYRRSVKANFITVYVLLGLGGSSCQTGSPCFFCTFLNSWNCSNGEIFSFKFENLVHKHTFSEKKKKVYHFDF